MLSMLAAASIQEVGDREQAYRLDLAFPRGHSGLRQLQVQEE